jgi:hypothetical protein
VNDDTAATRSPKATTVATRLSKATTGLQEPRHGGVQQLHRMSASPLARVRRHDELLHHGRRQYDLLGNLLTAHAKLQHTRFPRPSLSGGLIAGH